MAIDYKLFKPGHPLLDNIPSSEQLPGHYHARSNNDTTKRLEPLQQNYEDLYEIADILPLLRKRYPKATNWPRELNYF